MFKYLFIKSLKHKTTILFDNDYKCYSFHKSIYISSNLYKALNLYQLQSIIYHEIGHIEQKHSFKILIIILLMLLLSILLFFLNINIFIIFLVISILILKQINYFFEYKADIFAAKKTNPFYLIELLNYTKPQKSFFHPDYKKRIVYLIKYFNLFNK